MSCLAALAIRSSHRLTKALARSFMHVQADLSVLLQAMRSFMHACNSNPDSHHVLHGSPLPAPCWAGTREWTRIGMDGWVHRAGVYLRPLKECTDTHILGSEYA
ncbi:hypothetical protein BJX66DRAFT_301382 [Aspergillus keveii]|uniref:Uncharacterized protein n=1 Tax=Aspergillus keveii TaxID=714993 RepID=A0ABR4G9T8_9EURO